MGVVTSYMGGNVQFRVMVKVAVMLLSSVKPLLGIDVEPFFGLCHSAHKNRLWIGLIQIKYQL